ncbi:hypothetical protein [Methylocaldum marinum]|nr:hypothetical protein [Methylocaldum marinum]
MEDARRWLKKGLPVHPLTDGYMRRYGIERWVAQEELIDIGYREEVQIEAYEKEGVEWEFMYDPCSGEMKPVPIGTKKHELHLF